MAFTNGSTLTQTEFQLEHNSDGTHDTTGWNSATGETWTYASASTFTIATDLTARYTAGTRLKFTQTTVKYAVVVSSSYGAPNTTVTIAVNTDYVIANAAISARCFSYAANPQGYPGWFNYSPTLTGFSVNPANAVYRFSLNGKTCTLVQRNGTAGTSNATGFTVTLPVTAATITNHAWGCASGYLMDNSAAQSSPGLVSIASAGTVVTLYKTLAASAWTGSGTKSCDYQIVYEIP
jgi:hypothetical protein